MSVIIGLAGPMCAGKNAAAALLEEKGFFIIDADTVAHGVLQDLTPQILDEFKSDAAEKGIELQREDGSLDRRSLGSLLFSYPVLLKRHENLVYPAIDRALESLIQNHTDRNIVINAPVLHKSAMLHYCKLVLYIDAPVIIRLLRTMRRDNLPFHQIIARFRAQKSFFSQYAKKNVDIVRVENTGSLRSLGQKLDTVLSAKGY